MKIKSRKILTLIEGFMVFLVGLSFASVGIIFVTKGFILYGLLSFILSLLCYISLKLITFEVQLNKFGGNRK